MGVLVGSLRWTIWTQFLWGFSEEPIERSLLKIIHVNRWWENHLSISCHPPPSQRPHWGLPLEVWNTLEVRACHPEHPGTDGYSLGWNRRWSRGDVMSSPAASDTQGSWLPSIRCPLNSHVLMIWNCSTRNYRWLCRFGNTFRRFICSLLLVATHSVFLGSLFSFKWCLKMYLICHYS